MLSKRSVILRKAALVYDLINLSYFLISPVSSCFFLVNPLDGKNSSIAPFASQQYNTHEKSRGSGDMEEYKMPTFVRGLKVTTIYGDGEVINLPVNGRISVKYGDGTIRFFFPEDVITGRIRPAA